MTLTDLRNKIDEMLKEYGDSERDVTICVETEMYGKKYQFSYILGELVASTRYEDDELQSVKYILIDKDFD